MLGPLSGEDPVTLQEQVPVFAANCNGASGPTIRRSLRVNAIL